MKILGIQCYQDYNVCYYDTETKELKYIELEKLLKRKHFSFHSEKLDYMHEIDRIYNDNLRNNLYKTQKIIHKELGVDRFDLICWNYTRFEDGYLKKESFDFIKMLEKCDIQKFHHQENHVLPAIVENHLQEALCVSVDGKGDGNHAIYTWKDGKLTKLFQEHRFSYGMFYEVLSAYFLTDDHVYYQGAEGKFMAYAGLSNNFVKIVDIDYFMDKIKNTDWNNWEEKVKIQNYIFNFLDTQSQYFDKKDLAYTMQKLWLDSLIRDIAKYRHGQRNLVISGGCALNCMLNYLLIKTGWFENVYFTPIASDVGQSYGAVLNYLLRYKPEEIKHINTRQYSVTEAYRDKDYFKSIESNFVDISVNKIVDALADGKVIGVCRGNIEMGPRALGNRSILAAPFKAEMKTKLNELKGREQYRPYGILVPREEMGKYFDIDVDATYMNVLAYCNDSKLLLGAQHHDKTVRVQTVDKKNNPWLYNLLMAFKKRTGVPILINTSFNDSGLPIFNYVEDMYRMYQEKLDGLVIDEKMIMKD